MDAGDEYTEIMHEVYATDNPDDNEEDTVPKIINNLSFSGGGLKGVAFLGALRALEENDMLRDVSTIAGTSAGAIIATMLACRMTYADCRNMLMSVLGHFSEYGLSWLKVAKNVSSVKDRYGLYKTNRVRDYFRRLVASCSAVDEDEEITFSQLQDRSGIKLIITATSVQNHSPFFFSPDTTPDAYVSEALTISVNIPLLFQSTAYNDKKMVDGAVVENLPMQCWSDEDIPRTLAFLVKSDHEYFDFGDREDAKEYDIDSMFDFLEHLFITLRRGIDERYYAKYKDTIVLLHAGFLPYITSGNALSAGEIDMHIYSSYFQTLYSLKKKRFELQTPIPDQTTLSSYIDMQIPDTPSECREEHESEEESVGDSGGSHSPINVSVYVALMFLAITFFHLSRR